MTSYTYIDCPGICTDNEWKKVFSHNVSFGVFTDGEDVKLRNPFDPSAPLFSFLGNLDMLKMKEDPYHLRLCYPELIADHEFPCNEWLQSQHPMNSRSRDNMDTAITITFNKSGVGDKVFSGLGKNDAGMNVNTIIDGSPTNMNWWLAVGALKTIENKIQGPHGKWVSKVELFMKRSQPSTGRASYLIIYMYNRFYVDVREKRSVLRQKQSLIGFQDLYDNDREKRETELAETQEEMELRSYGSHLRFTSSSLDMKLSHDSCIYYH